MAKFVRTANVPRYRNPARYKQFLRIDFRYRCAYCGITEVYRRGDDAFGADHFRPRRLFPELACHYANLYYCCNRCNSFKGDSWPSDEEASAGFVFADPCQEDPYEVHLAVHDDGTLTPLTPCGLYTLDRLRLNREQLVIYRTRQFRIASRLQRCAADLRQLDKLRRGAATADVEAALAGLLREWESGEF
ncbi:MAG: hypothetical protein U0Q16_03065 [Bryobacteraceae bacterium]